MLSAVHLPRTVIFQALVRTLSVEERQVRLQAAVQRRHRLIIVQVHMLVLQAPPKPFHENVVQRPAAAVHTDRDPRLLQPARERTTGELDALIRVENLGLPNNYKPIWMTDVDYDGFDWGDSPQAFRWENNKRFPDLKTFSEAVGIEEHGIRVRKEDIFDKWSIPAEPARVALQHLPLKADSEAVDAGVVVPNIGDDFEGKAPDLGAYEHGRSVPQYGPRSR